MHMVEVDVGVADVWISLSETNIFIIIYSKIVSLRTIKGKEMHLCRTRRWRWTLVEVEVDVGAADVDRWQEMR